MSAKPRMTVRMAPSRLHQLAWLARKAGFTPGEYARICLTGYCEREIATGTALEDWQRDYSAWMASTGVDRLTADHPDQRAYDTLATRGLAEGDAPPAKQFTASTRPDGLRAAGQEAQSVALGREPRYEREMATITRSLRPDGRKRRS